MKLQSKLLFILSFLLVFFILTTIESYAVTWSSSECQYVQYYLDPNDNDDTTTPVNIRIKLKPEDGSLYHYATSYEYLPFRVYVKSFYWSGFSWIFRSELGGMTNKTPAYLTQFEYGPELPSLKYPNGCSDIGLDCSEEGTEAGVVCIPGKVYQAQQKGQLNGCEVIESGVIAWVDYERNETCFDASYTGDKATEPIAGKPDVNCGEFVQQCKDLCGDDVKENVCNDDVVKCACGKTPPPLIKDESGVYTDIDEDGTKDINDDDIDGDGIPNDQDEDLDGDGTVNTEDENIDGDWWDNDFDHDIDGDGELNKGDQDTDGDMIPNWMDNDIDGDGVLNGDDLDPYGDDNTHTEEVDNNSAEEKILEELTEEQGFEKGIGDIDTSGASSLYDEEKERLDNNIDQLKESIEDIFTLDLASNSNLPVYTFNIPHFNHLMVIDLAEFGEMFDILAIILPLLASIAGLMIILD